MQATSARLTRRFYLLSLCAVSICIVVLSVLAERKSLSGEADSILWRFSLGGENTVAAWWSGTLLLLGGLHAFDGYYRYREDDAKIAWSWLVIGAVLIALSLDEVGSLHERVATLRFGAWWSVLPFAVVLIGAVAWSFWQLWISHRHRSSSVLLAIGFSCFVAATGQEFVERAVTWTNATLPFRLAIEEGTELAGMLILIRAAMRNSDDLPTGLLHTRWPSLAAGHVVPPQILLAMLVAVPAFALITSQFYDQYRGHPSDWLAGSLLFLAALAFWRRFLIQHQQRSYSSMALALLTLAGSVVCVHVLPDKTVTIDSTVVGVRLALLSALLTGIAFFVWLRGIRANLSQPISYGLLLLALTAAAFAYAGHDLLTTYLLTGIVALFVYATAAPQVAASAAALLFGKTTATSNSHTAPGTAIDDETSMGFIGIPSRPAGELQFQLLEFTSDAIIIWEMDGEGIQYWNPAAERLYGYSRDEVRGKVTHTLLKTTAVGSGMSELETKLARYGMWVGELHHVDRRGKQIRVESRLSLMAQKHGRWLVLEVNRAVSNRGKAAAARHAAEQQLFTLRRYDDPASAETLLRPR